MKVTDLAVAAAFAQKDGGIWLTAAFFATFRKECPFLNKGQVSHVFSRANGKNKGKQGETFLNVVGMFFEVSLRRPRIC